MRPDQLRNVAAQIRLVVTYGRTSYNLDTKVRAGMARGRLRLGKDGAADLLPDHQRLHGELLQRGLNPGSLGLDLSPQGTHEQRVALFAKFEQEGLTPTLIASAERFDSLANELQQRGAQMDLRNHAVVRVGQPIGGSYICDAICFNKMAAYAFMVASCSTILLADPALCAMAIAIYSTATWAAWMEHCGC